MGRTQSHDLKIHLLPLLLAVPGLLLFQPAPVHGAASAADSVHVCAIYDYEQWRRDHPRPGAKRLADLDVGEPRTVRMIYFLPNDRPYRQEVVDLIKVRIREVQSFFVDQMEAHGHGKLTLRIETDANGEPLVHRVNGQHPDSHYLDDTHVVYGEIEQIFDLQENIYLIVVDHSIDGIGLGGGRIAAGTGGGVGYKKRGSALVPSNVRFQTVAHEIGHAFGLWHDFRDGAYIMSYGPGRVQLSACAAEFLEVHPYFNGDSSLETDKARLPTAELTTSPAYSADASSVPIHLKVTDSEGLHHVILFAVTRDIGSTAGVFEVKACRGLAGERETVVEFEYDGIPSSFVSTLSDPITHPIRVQVINSDGDVGHTDFVLSEISPNLVSTLMAHTGGVSSVSFSPDGGTLASGSWDGRTILWDVVIGGLTGILDGANAVSFSPDGALLAMGSYRTVKLWDVDTRNQIASLEGHTDGVNAVSFSLDGALLATGSWDRRAILWDVETRNQIAALEGHSDVVDAVSFSPDGSLLATGSRDRKVILWDVVTREQVATLGGHTREVASVSFSPSGAMLASGSGDGTAILWDVGTREQIATLEAHASGITGLSFSTPNGAILASGSRDGTILLWDILTLEEIAAFGHTSAVLSVSLSPRGSTLAAGGYDGTVLLWDVSEWTGPRPFALEIVSGDGQQGLPGAALAQPLVVEVRDQYGDLLPEVAVSFTVTAGEGRLSGRFAVEHARTDAKGRAELPLTLGLHPGPNTVGVSIGGRELATFAAEGVGTVVAALEGDYRTWHLPRAATVRLGKGAMGEGDRAVGLSADGRCLAVASAIGVWLYEAATSRALALLPTEGPVHSVSFSLDGTLAAGLDNGRVELWEVETGVRVGTLRHGRGRVTVAFSRTGTALASASGDHVIKLWDVKTKGEVGTWKVTADQDTWTPIPLAFSPDGTRLVSGFKDHTVRVWGVSTQTEVYTLEGHGAGITSVSFSPDGSLLASAGGWADPTVRLWDAATQTAVATLRGHRSEVRSVAFSRPDGGTLASAGGGQDATVRLWEVATGDPIATLEEHTGAVHSVTFSRDGATLASGAADGRVLLRDLEYRNAAGLSGHESLSSMAFSRDGALVAWGSQDGTIKLWDAVAQTQIAVLDGHSDRVAAVAFSPDGALLASAGGWEDPLKLWDVATRRQVGTLGRVQWGTKTISLSSPDGGRLAAGSWNGKITLWDVATRELIGTVEGHAKMRSVAFSPDGATLASGGGYEGMTVKLWDVKTLEPIATLEGHTGSVESVAFAPGGAILASGAVDGIKLWDAGTREPIGSLEGRGNTVSFSQDGTMLVSGTWRGVTLWDVATRRVITTLEGHARSVNHVALSPDRRNLISGSYDGTILLWDVTEWTGPRPSALEIISGDGQQGEPGVELTQPLVVEVRDQYGDPLPNAPVAFTVTAGDGQLSGRFTVEHAITDDGGRAELTLTLGPRPGPNIVGVSLGGHELAAFTAQGVGTAVAELEGDYRTWHLPAAATARLGKGAIGQGDRAVTLSADGQCLAVASAIGVWLYETATSRAQALLPTESAVHSVSFSPDGTLAAGLDNGRVELWGVEAADRVGTLRHADWGGVTVVFSPDGTRLASGSGQQVIKVWDVETRHLAGTWEVPRGSERYWDISVAFSPDGSRLVSGFQDGTVRLWDVATQTEVATLEGHTDRITSVSLAPDGRLLASGAGRGDRTVRLWDAATQTEVATLRGHTDEVRSVSFSPDGRLLASGGGWDDRTVRLWDVATKEEAATLEEHGGGIRSVAFSRDGATLVSGAVDGKVLLRDLETGNAAGFSGHGILYSMAFSPDGVLLASGHEDGAVRLWDAVTRTPIATLEGHAFGVGSVSFSSDGVLLASGSSDRTVKLWDVETRGLLGSLEGHVGRVTSVSFSPDGATLASAGGLNDATVRLWDVATREEIGILEGHTNSVESLAFSQPDGTLLASGGGREDKTVKLWDVGNRELIGTLEEHEQGVNTVAFSPDGKTLASGSDGLRLWDVATQTLTNRQGRMIVHSLAFSPDSKGLVSGSWGAVSLWDLETRTKTATLRGHTGSVHSVAFSRDGATLASGARDGTMLLWNLQPQPQSLTKLPGRRQQGAAGTALAEPFVVLVLDQYGDPLAGATVAFAVTAGGGTLSVTTATTDADGRAVTTLTLGRQPGTNTVRASVSGLKPVTFTATAEATPDFDGDGVTDFSDFFLFAEAFGGTDPRFDLDGSGTVDFADFLLFAESFGEPARAKLVAMARELIGLPDGPQLRQNTPNPFNRGTAITWFQLLSGPARLEVFALTGQRVAVLHEGPKKAGYHRLRWDARDDRGRPLASGVYVYRLVTAEAVQTRKLTLLR